MNKNTSPVSPAEALERLIEGNRRFVVGKLENLPSIRPVHDRLRLAQGQAPIAVILGCSDSRVPPEIIFDCGLGNLFVVRTAGHCVDDIALGSIEYAVEHLDASPIMVLGHARCGAVSAACSDEEPGEHISALVEAISVAAEITKDQPGDHVDNTVRAHASATARELALTGPVLSTLVDMGKLDIVAARYDLDTGHVGLL